MITAVITSCGRLDLLKKTIHSFNRYNTFHISHMIVIDDSGDKLEHWKMQVYLDRIDFSNIYKVKFIANEENIGQVRSIDKAYSEVTTPYIFHCEEDWEFYKHGFLEKSLEVLKADEKIITVWLRELTDTNTHPYDPTVYTANQVQYHLLSLNFQNIWHGFTWNPGLRRKSDYDLIKPFIQYGEGQEAAIAECHVGQEYKNLGFRGAILTEGAVRHAGGKESTRNSIRTDKDTGVILDIEKPWLGGNIVGGDPRCEDPGVWNYLIEKFKPKTLMDIGCGEGQLIHYFQNKGVAVSGVEGLGENIDNAHEDIKGTIVEHDYLKGVLPPIKTDMVISCEFVEHVHKAYLVNFLPQFVACKILVFTHAVEDQLGYHHVNCENDPYWINLMTSLGMIFLEKETDAARKLVRKSFWGSTLIFKKRFT